MGQAVQVAQVVCAKERQWVRVRARVMIRVGTEPRATEVSREWPSQSVSQSMTETVRESDKQSVNQTVGVTVTHTQRRPESGRRHPAAPS